MVVWKHRSSGKLESDAQQLLENGDFQGAARIWKHLVERHPGNAYALERLGTLRGMLGDPESATRLLTRAAEINPASIGAHYNLGLAYSKLGRHEAAVSAIRRAIELDPGFGTAFGELGRIEEAKGDYQAAIAAYARAAALAPDGPWINELVHCRHDICDWNQLEEDHRLLAERLQKTALPIDPITALQITDDPHFQRLNAEAVFAKSYAFETLGSPVVPPIPQMRRGNIKERLRVGYMSGDFRAHPISHLIVDLIERHDRSRFEVIGISVGPDDKSAVRARLRKAFDIFIDRFRSTASEIAAAVRKLNIDILIDLSGYTDLNRLQVLGFRPAPLQATYLGFPGALACPWLDYQIVDSFVVPPESEEFYSEALCFLPNTYQITSYMPLASDACPSRASEGLPDEAFVFCSFNNQMKIQQTMYDVWLGVLKRVPDSVLWLRTRNEAAHLTLKSYAASRGIAENRVIAAKPAKYETHLARQSLADLCLDTFPYNGHTTTSDALWAGVPVLTVSGRSFASRVAGSLLRAHGMDDLITSTFSEYADLAVKIGQSPEMIDALRARVRANRDTHPLFDPKRFCRNFEQALMKMWERRCRGEAPSPLHVSDSISALP